MHTSVSPYTTWGLLRATPLRRLHLQQVEFNEAIIDERNEEILEINRAVGEVNDVMKDLAAMVVEQQKDIGVYSVVMKAFVFIHFTVLLLLLLLFISLRLRRD